MINCLRFGHNHVKEIKKTYTFRAKTSRLDVSGHTEKMLVGASKR